MLLLFLFFSLFHFFIHYRLPARMRKTLKMIIMMMMRMTTATTTMIMTKTKPKRPWTIGCVATLFAFFLSFSLFKTAKIVCLFHVISFTLENKNKSNKSTVSHTAIDNEKCKKKTHVQPPNTAIIWFLKFVNFFGGFASSEQQRITDTHTKLNMPRMQSKGTWKMSESIFQDGGVCPAFDCPESIFTLQSRK